jgi:hypothetical protein
MMAISEFAKCIHTEPRGQIERDGKQIFDGILMKPQDLGTKCQFLYHIVTEAHVNEETPHVHDFPIILSFIGANSKDIYDFDGEIEFSIGGEKQIITKTSVVSVPAGTPHCPLVFKRVGKPIVMVEIMLTDNYTRVELKP